MVEGLRQWAGMALRSVLMSMLTLLPSTVLSISYQIVDMVTRGLTPSDRIGGLTPPFTSSPCMVSVVYKVVLIFVIS